jgi:hypothetical protein
MPGSVRADTCCERNSLAASAKTAGGMSGRAAYDIAGLGADGRLASVGPANKNIKTS